MKIKKDQFTGLLLVALGIAVAIMANSFKFEMTAAYPGPKLFPFIAAFGFVVCGLGIFLSSVFSHKEEEVFLSGAGWGKVFTILVALCLYIFVLKYLGYLITTPFMLYAFCTIIAKDGNKVPSIKGRIIFSVVFTILIYVVYIHVFSMTLPMGELFS